MDFQYVDKFDIVFCISAEMMEVKVGVSVKDLDGCNRVQCYEFFLKSCHFVIRMFYIHVIRRFNTVLT